MSIDLWTEASHDAEAALREQRFTAARVAVAPLWTFLAAADGPADYANRKAIVADRIDAACAGLADGAEFAVLRNEVESSLDEDFSILNESRLREAARERVFRRRIQAETARRRQATEESGHHVDKAPDQDTERHSADTPEGGDHIGPKDECPLCKMEGGEEGKTTEQVGDMSTPAKESSRGRRPFGFSGAKTAAVNCYVCGNPVTGEDELPEWGDLQAHPACAERAAEEDEKRSLEQHQKWWDAMDEETRQGYEQMGFTRDKRKIGSVLAWVNSYRCDICGSYTGKHEQVEAHISLDHPGKINCKECGQPIRQHTFLGETDWVTGDPKGSPSRETWTCPARSGQTYPRHVPPMTNTEGATGAKTAQEGDPFAATEDVANDQGARINTLRQIVQTNQATQIDGQLVDMQTANMLVQIHDALNPENQAKFDDIPLQKLVEWGWSRTKPAGGQQPAPAAPQQPAMAARKQAAEIWSEVDAPMEGDDLVYFETSKGRYTVRYAPQPRDPEDEGWYADFPGQRQPHPYEVLDPSGKSISTFYASGDDMLGPAFEAVDQARRIVSEAMRKGAPFADYKDFADCVSKNSDKDDPSAYCGKIKHQTEDKKESRRKVAYRSSQDVIDAYPHQPGISAGHGFYEGDGDSLQEELSDAGWRTVRWDAPYYWCMKAPDGTLLTYIEGDLYRGNKMTRQSRLADEITKVYREAGFEGEVLRQAVAMHFTRKGD